jgi:ribose transport system permease protein
MSEPEEAAAKRAGGRVGGRLGRLRDFGIVVSFAVLFVTLSVASDVFLTRTNLLNILDQWAPVGIVACAATLVITAGGFDLSVGAISAVAGITAAKVANGTSPSIGLLAGLASGLALGVGNGLLTTVGRIHPFIGTLASSFMIRGFALVLTGGLLITVDDPGFQRMGTGEALGVTYPAYAFAGFACLTGFLLESTTFGRYVYAAGASPAAATLSGVRVDAVRAATFALSGLSAGLAGIIVASRVATGQADAGIGLEFSVIAAVVIGGTSVYGGEGAIWRTVLGVLFLAMIGNGFNLMDIDPTYQQIIQGSIIVLAVGVDAWSRRIAAV